MLKRFLNAFLHLFHFLLAHLNGSHLLVEHGFHVFILVALALKFRLLLVELQFALLGFGFRRLDFLHARVGLFLNVGLHFQLGFLNFEQLVLLQNVCLKFRLLNYVFSPCVSHSFCHK